MNSGEIVRRPPFGQHPLVGERGSDTQRRILDAALTVFAEVGFNMARVELITKVAGCSRPSFYQYFASKDDVFWKLASKLGHEMIRLCEQLGPVSADAEGVATLTAWVDDFLTLHAGYAPVFAAFQSASRAHQDLAKGSRAIDDRTNAALLAAFDSSRDGTVTAGATSALVSMITRSGAMLNRALGKQTRTRTVTELAQIVHRVFCGPIAGVNMSSPPPASSSRVRRPRGAVPIEIAAPAVTPRRGEKTRALLLEAGAKVLPAHGYHDSRVDDIVATAGLSHGSFYRYFDSKDDLFRTLAVAATAQMMQRLDAFPTAHDAASVRDWLTSWFGAYHANGGVISTWQEVQIADREMVELSDHVAAACLQRLVRVLRPRTFGDPLVDALALIALLERVPYSAFTLEFISEHDAIEAMVTVMQRGFFGVAGGSAARVQR